MKDTLHMTRLDFHTKHETLTYTSEQYPIGYTFKDENNTPITLGKQHVALIVESDKGVIQAFETVTDAQQYLLNHSNRSIGGLALAPSEGHSIDSVQYLLDHPNN